ncbi:MAG: hypothetical protein AAB288_04105, partial [Acidobacteriota bacterium]
MSSNDELVLGAHFKTWMLTRGSGLSGMDGFTFYCVEQFLKPFDVADDEILNGNVEGGNDGGLDAVYFFVDSALVDDTTSFVSKGAAPELNLTLFQIKDSHQGFSPIEIGKLRDFLDDLLDLS